MSKEENRKMISAYEKMLQDGRAFKEVDMTMHTQPDLGEATGSRETRTETQTHHISDNPMGEPLEEYENKINDGDADFTHFDSVMEQRMSSLRSKMDNSGVRRTGKLKTPKQEIAALKNRVAKLEEALVLVMETHEQLLS
jgi:hypothetical protein